MLQILRTVKRSNGKICLVACENEVFIFFRHQLQCFVYFLLAEVCEVEQINHNIRSGKRLTATLNTYAFYHIGSVLANSGSINQSEDNAVDIERFLNRIAGCAGYIAYYGAFFIQ